MSSYPLPALDIKAPAPSPDAIEQYGRLAALKNSLAMQPLQQQAAQQQVQSGALENQQKQIQLQQAQQGQQDQQYIRQLATENKGKTVGELADIGLQSGKLSPQTYTQLKKSDLEQRTSLESLTKEQLANADASHKQLQQIYDSAQDMTPEQLQQNWPAIVQQANAVHTNTPLHLDPNQPMTKEQLQQFAPFISMQGTYLNEAAAKQEKAATLSKTTAEAKSKQAEVDFYAKNGGAPGVPVEAQQQADWLAKNPGKGPSDFAVAQAGRKAAAEESARLPGEMALARQRQALSQGDPKAAASLLVNGDATLSELKARGATPEFIQKTLQEAHNQSGGQYNAQKAEADFKIAGSQANTAFFGSAKSLTDPNGTLDQLSKAGRLLPKSQIVALNTIADWEKAATSNGPLAHYAATALGVADDYAKVMGGGVGSDTSRMQALNLAKANAGPEARAGAISGIRDAVNSQVNSRIGNNPIMKRMYGDASPSSAPATSGLGVKLSAAMALPRNQGKTAEQVKADIAAHGHTVIE